eukprot:CAMPEP_0172304340 /NCGR_PEP_ID=MMETSP1058-20130122/5760_1 /TAXON_ID=83371 /ORGANISM="Detonula confervacea, Strain CCMP 353" /LENGTH=560 /DNA_ID=CAMNT_0013015529 /DNA_START=54 /DNA_END=1733 /DNA_ORIENTATION=+
MGFRVVDKSYFSFATDLPLSSRNIHPSGVLHAFRSTAASSESSNGREEHTFAWISNSLHIELAIKDLETFGFDRSHGIVFIPYSTKRNWLDRYPHAAPALETTEHGKIVVYLNSRPYPNGLGEMGGGDDAGQQPAAMAVSADTKMDDQDAPMPSEKKRKRKSSQRLNIVQDNSLLPNAERDELHIEIYNYLSWLHDKLADIERKAEAEAAEAAAEAEAKAVTLSSEEEVISRNEDDNKAATAAASISKRKMTSNNGVDMTELRKVVENLESTFAIIPNYKLNEEPQAGQSKGAPFIEEALSNALNQLVAARELAGKPKRSRKLQRRSRNSGRPHSHVSADFDIMFQRLVQYKEEHGDCLVSKSYKEDPVLGNWVCRVREKKKNLLKKGIEVEEVPPGREILAKTLTAERLDRLNSVEFVWSVAGPTVAWEDRFKELIEYYKMNDKWPSQSMGTLGDWVHKQRTKYSRKDSNFMKSRAPKLDAVGFEWTPRGYTRMSWDEGFEMLMEFGRINGNFDVPAGSEVDKKSDAHRLHKWVGSLHDMYRSYKLGRQSGSLSDERVV